MVEALLRRIVREEIKQRQSRAIIPGQVYEEPSKTRLSMALAKYLPAQEEAA